MHTVFEFEEEVNDLTERIFGPIEKELRKLLEMAKGFEEIKPPTYAEFHYGKEVDHVEA